MTIQPRTKDDPQGPWEVAEDFYVPEGFKDTSWEQDVNPSVTSDLTGHSVYWDTEDNANMRAEGVDGPHRFFVLHTDTGKTLYEGDCLEQALTVARGGDLKAYTNLLNVLFRALARTVAYGPTLDLDDCHAAAALNGNPDENLYRYLRHAVQF